MTIDEEKYYENYFDLFNTPGWKQLQEELQDIYQTYSVDQVASLEELYFSKGERSILSKVLNFENGIEAAYASIQEGQAEEGEVVGYTSEDPDF
jgi:hypothetical protein